MLWAAFILNIATVVIALRKRMILYALANAVFLYLITGQGLQISSDLDRRHAVQYLFNFITDVGFSMAVHYVFWCSLISCLIALAANGFAKKIPADMNLRFSPPAGFYWAILIFLTINTIVLIFAVVGLDTFLHSSRPGYESGATIFIVLLAIGILPVLLKILSRSKVRRADVICALFASAVTAAFSRIHIFLYLTAILLALFYGSGWYRRTFSVGMILRLSLAGSVGFAVFFGIGSLHDAQNYTHGSISDLISYLIAHPERSLLSIDYNYRVGIEGMSGIAGAYSQYFVNPTSARFDFGASWVLRGAIQWLPGFLKTVAEPISDWSADLNWYSVSVVPTGAETFFTSFGWAGVLLYPISIYLLSWRLQVVMLLRKTTPLMQVLFYVLSACLIFFVRGSLPVWIAFSVSYTIIFVMIWPVFSRHLHEVEDEADSLEGIGTA